MGLRSQVSGLIGWLESLIDRKMLRFMGEASAWSYLGGRRSVRRVYRKARFQRRVGVVMGGRRRFHRQRSGIRDLLREKESESGLTGLLEP